MEKNKAKDFDTIDLIVERTIKLHANQSDQVTLFIDLMKCHDEVTLDLEKLLNFPVGDFLHDIYGIQQYMDRRTGILKDCFLPRSISK
jgi:hypothetical protein